ncbi:putative U3 small nucleolar RNA-associated protein 11 [Gadus morhua]|uniref:U3 small nucleolar RNA-associated protein 11 n=1 Tax=Gadus morhua TaxID=8049 RepID=A0A8C4Z771_GADMO|nr:probable U3 small nucleolar RNA-associated protein 11 [Gadus morhua]
MATFRKALKSKQRNHHERAQLGSRNFLGLLEKKKDYKLRANDYHKKQNLLSALRRKAMEKNPDEFYYKMISSKLEDGVHRANREAWDVEVTEEQRKMMRTQDLKYVEMRRLADAKKIERMKGELHLLDAKGKQENQHTFFVDSKREVQDFSLAERLNTVPELVGRAYNRPTLETLKTKIIKGPTDNYSLQKLARQRGHQYTILSQRIERERKLYVIGQKIQSRREIQEKTKRVKMSNETKEAAAVYKYEAKRKR